MTGEDAWLEAAYEDINGSDVDDEPVQDDPDEPEHECSFPRDRETNEPLPCWCGMDPDTYMEEHPDDE